MRSNASHCLQRLTVAACVCALAIILTAESRAADTSGWASGPTLAQKLEAPLSVGWQGTPLARALAGLAEAQHVAVLRDRRVDPNQSIQLAIDNQPLGNALTLIAEQLKIGYSQFGPVAYFGPPQVAARLRTVAAMRLEDAKALPAEVSSRFLTQRNWHWPMLAEPRQLLAELEKEAGVEVVNPQRIPHDLWPELDLPPLTWLDRLTLLAAQFDLTFRLSADGRSVELVELPDEVSVARTYAGGKNAKGLVRRWAKDFPQAKISVVGDEVQVVAMAEDHDLIEKKQKGTPTRKTTVAMGKEVYQLNVEKAALDKLVDQLTQRLGLTFKWDREATMAAGIASDQLVSVKVENADLETLLKAVFADTGLTFRRSGRTVTVKADTGK
jgi:hypothetical protein